MKPARCPTCRQEFNPTESRAMPFCSERCRAIDLGRWLKEDVSIPFRERPDNEQEHSAADEA